MPSDPEMPLLKLNVKPQQTRIKGKPRSWPRSEAFAIERQNELFSPKFDRLADILSRDAGGLQLRSDPTALAPERLLVFEVQGTISSLANAIQRITGLELVDEEELETDGEISPVAYLMVPDVRALTELLSLWKRWQTSTLVRGETPWKDVFNQLRDLRPWSAIDRIRPTEASILENEIFGRADDDLIKLEIEFVFRAHEQLATTLEQEMTNLVAARNGTIICRSRIAEIAYHAVLVELPVRHVREIIGRVPGSIASLESILYIRPQSLATSTDAGEFGDTVGGVDLAPLSDPILALLDGVPVAGHTLLAERLVLEDLFNLEQETPVAERGHGTAMASLILHGDLNKRERPLARRIHCLPVLGAGDTFPRSRLIVDTVYSAIVGMREGAGATAPGILIVNLSLGDSRRPFHGQLSPWARLLDRLSYRLGILFIVSAGNVRDQFTVAAFNSRSAFEDSPSGERAVEVLRALGGIVADRRLIAPAETVNGITVGGCNEDAVTDIERAGARANIDPYGVLKISNPSSALGPGFALAVKPDILMPGAREHLRVIRTDPHIDVSPAQASRSAGLRVAAPPRNGLENQDMYTSGTSAAAALASRTCHRIHDALELVYGIEFTQLPHRQRAALLKALLVHPARWPPEAAALIRTVIGPASGRLHVQQRDNIRRFLGYGIVDADDAIACSSDRATFWATGTIESDKTVAIDVPIPSAIGGQARFHLLSATLAWLSPTSPGRKSYRGVRLIMQDPAELSHLGVSSHRDQPDLNQTKKGTLFTRCWTGDRAPIMPTEMSMQIVVQRDPDQGIVVDEPIPFGLAITLTMPGVVEIYNQVRERLALLQRARV